MKKLLMFLLVCSSLVHAKGTIEVLGTSTLHDWKMTTNSVDVKIDEKNNFVNSLYVSFVIETLKSGDEGLDEKAYETLKVDRKKSISFQLLEQKADGSFDGIFRIGDHEKRVNVFPDSIKNGEITGTLKANMTSFGLTPPSFMFGAMSAGDEVTVKYKIFK